jgi:hypothetical protein
LRFWVSYPRIRVPHRVIQDFPIFQIVVAIVPQVGRNIDTKRPIIRPFVTYPQPSKSSRVLSQGAVPTVLPVSPSTVVQRVVLGYSTPSLSVFVMTLRYVDHLQ